MKKSKLIVLVVILLTFCAGCDRFAGKDIPFGSHQTNVIDCGATGNDDTDDTSAIQKAVDEVYKAGGGKVWVPDGIYMIDAVQSIRLRSKTQLLLSPNAILQAAANSSSDYAVVKISNSDNVKVVGGRIIGDRDNHMADRGEWGHGIQVLGSSKVRISDVTISHCWGDGIYIGSSKERNYCTNVIVEKFDIHNCRRNGITVISGRSVTIREGVISDTNGTNPQSAICLEPNNAEEYMEDILIDNVKATNSAAYGLLFGLSRYVDTPHDLNITLRDFVSLGHGKAAYNDYSRFKLSRSRLRINIL